MILSIYDSQLDQWSHQQMPRPYSRPAAFIHDGALIVSGTSPALAVYDLLRVETGVWESHSLPTRRYLHSAADIGPYFVFAGGYDDTNTLLPTADIFNTLTGEWTTTLIPTVLADRGLAVLPDDNMIMIGGGRVQQPKAHVDIFSYSQIGSAFNCFPVINSTGVPAELMGVGSPKVIDDFVTFTASDMPVNQWGYFLVGDTPGIIPGAGGSQGTLCLGLNSTIGRYSASILSTGPDGVFWLSPNLAMLPTSPVHAVAAGETWYFQAWYRDVNPGPTSNFTRALEVTFE